MLDLLQRRTGKVTSGSMTLKNGFLGKGMTYELFFVHTQDDTA
ncbi:hypothetical protein ABH924_004930 [Arthrobacter sp. GAS37]